MRTTRTNFFTELDSKVVLYIKYNAEWQNIYGWVLRQISFILITNL